MVNENKIEGKLRKEVHKLESEDEELEHAIWEEYKKDRQELNEIQNIRHYIKDLKKEMESAFGLVHRGEFRKSSEYISDLRGKIIHVRGFLNHLKSERERRSKENKIIYKLINKVDEDVKILEDGAQQLAKKIGL